MFFELMIGVTAAGLILGIIRWCQRKREVWPPARTAPPPPPPRVGRGPTVGTPLGARPIRPLGRVHRRDDEAYSYPYYAYPHYPQPNPYRPSVPPQPAADQDPERNKAWTVQSDPGPTVGGSGGIDTSPSISADSGGSSSMGGDGGSGS